MAAGAEVCRYSSPPSLPSDFSTIPKSLATLATSSNSLVKRFARHVPWRALPQSPTRHHCEQKSHTSAFSFTNWYMCSSCVFGKFSCALSPQTDVLSSQRTVRLHLNRLLLGSIQPPFCPFLVNMKTVKSPSRKETTQVGRSKDATVSRQVYSGDSHLCAESEVTGHEAMGCFNEYEDVADKGTQCVDEYGYDSENEDDFIQFSDEFTSDAAVSDPEPEHSTLTTDARPENYVTLCSQESGFCDDSDLPSSFDDWSDCDSSDESDTKPASVGINDLLWSSFEAQALSPQICPKRTSCSASSTSTLNNCPQNLPSDNSSECGDIIHEESPRVKRVSFKADPELVVVHPIIAWDYAYRAARKGPWEQYARDRLHFSRRIDAVASILEPCLAKQLGCRLT